MSFSNNGNLSASANVHLPGIKFDFVQLYDRIFNGDAIHVVKAGESLWSIAKLHGSSIEAIRIANAKLQIQNDVIHPGQKLRVPKP